MANKLISKIKTKLLGKKELYPLDDEFKFSTDEIEEISFQNKQKIENLQSNTSKKKVVTFSSVSRKLDGLLDNNSVLDDVVSVSDDEEDSATLNLEFVVENEVLNEDSSNLLDNKLEEDGKEIDAEQVEIEITASNAKEDKKKSREFDSYINLSDTNQNIITEKWNSIDLQQIDKDIIEGKDLLNHNYNITYGDSAAKFVHDIRKKYEVVICYLIGFNNEKKGIYNKTIFANRVDDEWKYLSHYIKLLEKIRTFRK